MPHAAQVTVEAKSESYWLCPHCGAKSRVMDEKYCSVCGSAVKINNRAGDKPAGSVFLELGDYNEEEQAYEFEGMCPIIQTESGEFIIRLDQTDIIEYLNSRGDE